MDITPLVAAGRQLIAAYGDGRFRITGVAWECPILILPEQTQEWHGVTEPANAYPLESLAPLLDFQPAIEFLIIGTGKRLVPLAGSFRRSLQERGISVDMMDTGAACRTFNVLLTEERRVAAALLPV